MTLRWHKIYPTSNNNSPPDHRLWFNGRRLPQDINICGPYPHAELWYNTSDNPRRKKLSFVSVEAAKTYAINTLVDPFMVLRYYQDPQDETDP